MTFGNLLFRARLKNSLALRHRLESAGAASLVVCSIFFYGGCAAKHCSPRASRIWSTSDSRSKVEKWHKDAPLLLR
jgi:hypothetical protein